jgi:5-methyltetrahydropteroyltriglutamate--homocysteine methyltransferase
VSREVEAGAWKEQADAGLSLIALDGTLYDHILDLAVTYLGLVPSRFAGLSGLDLYFAAARGVKGATALDMSKVRSPRTLTESRRFRHPFKRLVTSVPT